LYSFGSFYLWLLVEQAPVCGSQTRASTEFSRLKSKLLSNSTLPLPDPFLLLAKQFDGYTTVFINGSFYFK
jgi:hypothetical protein